MSKLGISSLYIGVEFLYFNDKIMLIQYKYAEIIIERFQMIDCHSIATPMEEGVQLFTDMDLDPINEFTHYNLIGSLIYYMITQQDLSFQVNCLSRFILTPQKVHMAATKRVLKYIKSTTNFMIFFPTNGEELIFYVDVDWA
jgi:hypothetical protein